MQFFLRPFIGPQITCSDPGLSHHCFGSHSLKAAELDWWHWLYTWQEYLMDNFFLIHYQPEDKLLRWKVMPNKTALIDWTYRTCWNSGEEPKKVICKVLHGRWAPPPFPHSPLHRNGLYIYIGSDLWNICQLLRQTAPLDVRYHSALCLGRQDDRIRRISQASNIKKPPSFMVTSWIVRNDTGHNSAIRSVCLFCYRTSTSATLCQDAK